MFLRDDERVEYYSLDYVVSELQNDPTKHFKRVSDGLVLRVEDNCLNWESGHGPLSFQDEWMDYVPNMDRFVSAYAHLLDGDDIMCVRKDGTILRYSGEATPSELLEMEFSSEDVYDGLWVIVIK